MARGCRIIAPLLGLCALFAWAMAGSAQAFEWDRLEIETGGGHRHGFRIELAVTPGDKSRGLMFRRSLADDAGMLFVYRPARRPVMWMKNTHIPLDMLFIRPDGVIAQIVERTVPLSLERIAAEAPVAAVLELKGGTAGRLGLAPGDRVLYRAFASTPGGSMQSP